MSRNCCNHVTSQIRCNLWINLRERCDGWLERSRWSAITDEPAYTLIIFPPGCGKTLYSIEEELRRRPSHCSHHHKHGTVSGFPHAASQLGNGRKKSGLMQDLTPHC